MMIRSIAAALALFLAAPAIAQDAAPAEQGQVEILPDITMGAEDAPLTIFEYASFTCGHCAAFHDESWPKLKADYIDTGKVRFRESGR